ncbi:Versicolorin B desaturase [Lachnellula willkommii]|uniref:Versicolorin B desaturase n=1 Tax=Lachnellula willkommii TaxID=215461 RepID=A0A559MMI1_9HELO|nr:Versicolorin B desaturase [Lachnellula willkommii]
MDNKLITTLLALPSIFLVLVALVVGGVSIVVYRLWLHPLAPFPGPKLWGATRLPWIRNISRGWMWLKIEHLHEQYGSIVRIAPTELSFSSPGAWEDIYSSRPLLPKEPSSQTPPLNGAHSLFTALDDDHRRLRGALAAGFSDKALRDQAPLIEHHATELVARLRRELAASAVPILNIQKFFGYAALDTITDLSYGESMNGLADRNEHGWIARFFLHGRFSTVRMCLCWCSPLDKILDFLFLALTRKQRAKNWAIFSAKIERRLMKGDMEGQRSDLVTPVIGKVIDEAESKGPKARGITKKELLSHCLASVVANSQLTTVALTTCTYLLLRNKRAVERQTAEIREAFASEEEISVQSTQGLVYLDAVLHETMRVRHPTPINLPRVVPPEGRVIDGTFIPGNTIVGINLHVCQTNPANWVDGHAFHPERFLPASDARYERRFDGDVKAAYMPFSTGPMNCVGGKLFFAEARVTMAKLLWNFDLKSADVDIDTWLDRRAYIVWEPKELRVELIDRRIKN